MPHKQNSSRTSSRNMKSSSNQLQKQPNKPTRILPADTEQTLQIFTTPEDPSELPNYDYSKDRGRRLRLRQEEQCVFNHSAAEKSPLLDVKQWREKLKQLRALPKPNESQPEVKRPRHKPHKGNRTPKHKKYDHRTDMKHLKISANIPSGANLEYLEDSDMVSFGEILNPKITADTRYNKYLEELGRDGGADDLESLCNEHGDPIISQAQTTPQNNNNDHVMMMMRKIDTRKKPPIKSQHNDLDNVMNVTDLGRRVLSRRQQVLVRPQSTDPVMSISGSHGLLHDKPQTESRLSLNNFKLRLQLADDNEMKQNEILKSGSQEFDSSRKHQTLIDSARIVDQGVKLANYVTKAPFSPRRMNTSNRKDVRDEQVLNLRRETLHLPISTNTRNIRYKPVLPSTNTIGMENNKGGGWRMAQQGRRDIDYNRLIPVSIIGEDC